MSGLEILAIAASVIQIADVGAKLSVKLFTFTRKAKGADRSVHDITQEIAATGAALRELGETLKEDRFAYLGSRQSIESTSQIVADCWKVFEDINNTIDEKTPKKQGKSDSQVKSFDIAALKRPSFTFSQRLRYPFVEPQIDLLKTKLQGLKSSLILMLQVLSLAEQVRNRPKAPISIDDKYLIEVLVRERNEYEKKFEKLLKALECPPNTGNDLPLPVYALLAKASTNVPSLQDELVASKLPEQDIEETNKALVDNEISIDGKITATEGYQSSVRANSTSSFEHSVPSVESPCLKQDQTHGVNAPFAAASILPLSFQLHEEEIQHHTTLVDNLLQIISDVQYRIDYGIRHRMQNGVMKLHWDEWSLLADRCDNESFLQVLGSCKTLMRYWVDQKENLTYATPRTTDPSSVARQVIYVKDTLGRTFSVPWEESYYWKDIVKCIGLAFVSTTTYDSRILHGEFDLYSSDGSIIIPELWNKSVRPGMEVSIKKWALSDRVGFDPETRSNLKQKDVIVSDNSHTNNSAVRKTPIELMLEERDTIGEPTPETKLREAYSAIGYSEKEIDHLVSEERKAHQWALDRIPVSCTELESRYVSPEILDHFGLTWRYVDEDPSRIHVKGDIGKKMIDELYAHTRTSQRYGMSSPIINKNPLPEPAIELKRPTFIKVDSKYIASETLDYYSLPWEWETGGTGFFIIKMYINEEFAEELFEHTRRLRSKTQPTQKEPPADQTFKPNTSGNDKTSDDPDPKAQVGDNGNVYFDSDTMDKRKVRSFNAKSDTDRVELKLGRGGQAAKYMWCSRSSPVKLEDGSLTSAPSTSKPRASEPDCFDTRGGDSEDREGEGRSEGDFETGPFDWSAPDSWSVPGDVNPTIIQGPLGPMVENEIWLGQSEEDVEVGREDPREKMEKIALGDEVVDLILQWTDLSIDEVKGAGL